MAVTASTTFLATVERDVATYVDEAFLRAESRTPQYSSPPN